MLSKIKSNFTILVISLSIASLSMVACSDIYDSQHLTNRALADAPVNLIVGEGFENPLGYYESQPRFSWKIDDRALAQSQTAYQIQVASDILLFNTVPDYWDTLKVQSEQTSWVRYEGSPLNTRQKVYWRVRFWDEQEQVSNWSKPASIELGLLSNADWLGQWIGHPDTTKNSNDISPNQSNLATPQYLRKPFIINKPIKHARLYISAKGIFKPYLNGQEVAPNDVMLPGWTPYDTRIESLTYDVTSMLTQGENVLGASLAGGWYSTRVYKFLDTEHQVPARLLTQLEITFTDDSKQTVVSDDSWQVSQDGPIRFASIYDGEKYDQGKEIKGWNTSDFDASHWATSIIEPLTDDIQILPKRHAPIRVTEQMQVYEIVSVNEGKVIFDFGQNMVGVPRLSIPVVVGQEVTVRYAEALHKGEFYTDNYRSAKSINHFMPSENGVVEYEPTFTYHGYRYIEISGYDQTKQPTKDWATAQIQHSDVNIHANFSSSHPKLNKLSKNITWGLRSNFYDIPLDCPQRDERLGWTGDAQVFVTPSMFMADVYGFWSAWLQSIREEQGDDGKIPLYVPFVEWINFASSGWGDAVTIIPWELYMMTGDETVLTDNYEMMLGWVGYHQKKSQGYVSNMTTFGDWLQPYSAPASEDGQGANRGDTNFSLIGTAYFAHSVALTLNTAKVLGKEADISRLQKLHQNIKTAFLTTFFDNELNLLSAKPTQTTYLLGLAYDLFPKEKRALAVDKLIDLIELADNHLRTGFLGTPLLTQVLQEAGRSDIIYDLLFKETYPSWFYSINNGATTTWERWNSYTIKDGFNPEGMNSLNHYAYGTVSRWFYEGILGIKPITPGFKSISIEPQFGEQLKSASGSYNTPQGKVSVDWTLLNSTLSLKVTIPKNTTATIILPILDSHILKLNGQETYMSEMQNIGPGRYQIEVTL